MAMGLVMDEVQTDEDGNVVNKFSNQYVGMAVTAVRYLTMLLMYGGITLVIVGLFTMTPETANGRGSVPLVSDAVNSTPVGDAPPGVAFHQMSRWDDMSQRRFPGHAYIDQLTCWAAFAKK